MPDTKITALTALTTADPATDMFPIVDVSDTTMAASGTTKRISINNILACSPSATLASATITGDLTVDTSTLKVDSTNDNVGIGTTTPASYAFNDPAKLVIANTGTAGAGNTFTIASGSTGFGNLAFANGTSGTARYNGYIAYNHSSNFMAFYTNAGAERYRLGSDGTATWSVGGSTAMTLNSTGLGVGTVAANGIKLATYVTTAGGPATSGTTQSAGSLRIGAASTAGVMDMGTAGSYSWIQPCNSGNLATNYNLVLNPNGGELLMGTTNASVGVAVGLRTGDGGGRLELGSVNSTNSNIGFDMYSTGAAAYRFYVGYGGTVFATNTTISAISDARLKENVQDIDVGLAAILALKPRKFDWKAGKGKDIKGDRGFIAQEFETVFPNLIDEWKDEAPEGEAPYKSVRQDLIPVLVKAIQELTARVQTLEAK